MRSSHPREKIAVTLICSLKVEECARFQLSKSGQGLYNLPNLSSSKGHLSKKEVTKQGMNLN